MHNFLNQQADREKALAIYLDVLLAVGGTLGSRTSMWKAFWASHLIHFRDHGVDLSGWPILKWKFGPGPQDPFGIEAELRVRGLLDVKTEESAGYTFVTLSLTDAPRAESEVARVLSEDARKSVHEAAEWQRHMGAAELSHHTHENSIAWLRAPKMAPIEVSADLLKSNPLGKLTHEDKARLEADRAYRAASEQYFAQLFAT